MRPLAILRPEPGGSLSAARAEAMGFEEIIRLPLFKVRPCEWKVPDADRFDAARADPDPKAHGVGCVSRAEVR